MSTVRIPPTLRAATGGAKQVEVPGGTVREVVAGPGRRCIRASRRSSSARTAT